MTEPEAAAAFVLDQVAASLSPEMFKDEAEGRRIIAQIRDNAARLRIAGYADRQIRHDN